MDDTTITIKDEDGVTHDFILVTSFDHPHLARHYYIYTDNIPDEDGNIEYLAMYQDEGEPEDVAHEVEEDEDWALVNEVIGAFLE
jgi:uncharacterized protein YrzB (UPF0473 family)